MCRPLNSKELQRIFEKLDKNGDGVVSVEEIKWVLDGIGVAISLEEIGFVVEGKSSLNLNEFISFYASISSSSSSSNGDDDDDDDDDDDLVKAFKVFDMNGDGFISCEELQMVLSRLGLWDGKDCRVMICVYDTNLDGMLDYQEFKHMMSVHAVS